MQNLLEVDAEAESLANDHVPAAAESDVQLRGKVMSHRANKLHMPYLTISI